jgi:hypothetical protein
VMERLQKAMAARKNMESETQNKQESELRRKDEDRKRRMVGRCRLSVSKPVLKAPMVSAPEAKM